MRLMDTTTDTEIMPGCTLRPVEPPRTPWRLESLHTTIDGATLVHASQRTRVGRAHRIFHPHVFGLEIVVDVEVTRSDRVHHAMHAARTKVNDYMLAGLFALVPLAFFEHFHLAERVFAAFTSTPHGR